MMFNCKSFKADKQSIQAECIALLIIQTSPIKHTAMSAVWGGKKNKMLFNTANQC